MEKWKLRKKFYHFEFKLNGGEYQALLRSLFMVFWLFSWLICSLAIEASSCPFFRGIITAFLRVLFLVTLVASISLSNMEGEAYFWDIEIERI